jgi:hypothetical protein
MLFAGAYDDIDVDLTVAPVVLALSIRIPYALSQIEVRAYRYY